MILAGVFCPACGFPSLMVASDGGAFGCTRPDCPDRDAAWKVLTDPEIHHIVRFDGDGFFTVQHPLRERVDGALFDCVVHEELKCTSPLRWHPGVGGWADLASETRR